MLQKECKNENESFFTFLFIWTNMVMNAFVNREKVQYSGDFILNVKIAIKRIMTLYATVKS